MTDTILWKPLLEIGYGLEKEIIQRVKTATGVKPLLEFMDKDKIYDGQKMKIIRVIDLRQKTGWDKGGGKSLSDSPIF